MQRPWRAGGMEVTASMWTRGPFCERFSGDTCLIQWVETLYQVKILD